MITVGLDGARYECADANGWLIEDKRLRVVKLTDAVVVEEYGAWATWDYVHGDEVKAIEPAVVDALVSSLLPE